jgi:hypothetical protein
MSDETTPECTPNAHHELREQYAHLAIGHHPDCSCILCGLKKMSGFVYQQPPREYCGRWPGSDKPPLIKDFDEHPKFDHIDPVWRRLADYLIFYREDDYDGSLFEQLWASKVAPLQFQICCTPGFAYGLALGDVVETDGSLLIQRVIERSNHSTFRISSDEGWYGRIDVLNRIAALGGVLELLNHVLHAIDVEGDETWALWDYLQEGESEGLFEWEQGHWGEGSERPE